MQLHKIRCFSCSQNQITFREDVTGVQFRLQLRGKKCRFFEHKN